jgi:hypothetical protein
LSLDSRCFRLQSTGTYAVDGQAMARRATAHLEAVVVFEGDGSYTITHWTAGLDEESEPAPAAEPVPAEGAQDAPGADGAIDTTEDTAAQAG